jgi:hypothetical protein
MRKCTGNLELVVPHDFNFGEVLVYLHEGTSDDESESECTVRSDHNMECDGTK